LLAKFRALGVYSETYRSVVRAQLYAEKFTDVLAVEREISDEAEQVSFYILSFGTEEEANATIDEIATDGFLPVWNTIRSRPFDAESDSTANAFEILWRQQVDLAGFGAEVQTAAFTLPIGVNSDALIQANATTGVPTYYIIQVSGRELRPLTAAAYEARKREVLTSFLDTQIAGSLEIKEFWRGRVPTQPVLDPKFLAPPTPAPATPGAISP
jgi:mRNA-degrading endonuclease HigB of HigAB toxin-antitoxin module